MGYKFQFVTLAGFHALNLSMFELARHYREKGMSAYSNLQEKEFASEREHGYQATKHQRFVGTGYFDQVQQVISGGLSFDHRSGGLNGSRTIFGRRAKRFRNREAKLRPPIPSQPPISDWPQEEMLQPSGD